MTSQTLQHPAILLAESVLHGSTVPKTIRCRPLPSATRAAAERAGSPSTSNPAAFRSRCTQIDTQKLPFCRSPFEVAYSLYCVPGENSSWVSVKTHISALTSLIASRIRAVRAPVPGRTDWRIPGCNPYRTPLTHQNTSFPGINMVILLSSSRSRVNCPGSVRPKQQCLPMSVSNQNIGCAMISPEGPKIGS